MDIICRICGEPYSCTGGLHFSHTDMQWWEFDQFIRGKGCPSCLGAPRIVDPITQGRIDDSWARSIRSASDEVIPYPGFATLVESPVVPGQWNEDEPTVTERLNIADRMVLSDAMGSNWSTNLDCQNPEDLGARMWAFRLPFINADSSSLVDRANFKAFETLSDSISATYNSRITWDTSDRGKVWVGVIEEDRNCGLSLSTGVKLVQALSTLKSGEILDQEVYDELMEEAYKEAVDDLVDDLVSHCGRYFDTASSVLTAIIRDLPGVYENASTLRQARANLTLDEDDVVVEVAVKLGMTGWRFYRTKFEYSADRVVVTTRDPNDTPGPNFPVQFVFDGDALVDENVMVPKVEYEAYDHGLKQTKLCRVREDVVLALLEKLS